jgi:hypothetical protein
VDGGDSARGRGVGEKHWDLERRKWLAAARVWREGVSCQMVSESVRGRGEGRLSAWRRVAHAKPKRGRGVARRQANLSSLRGKGWDLAGKNART